MEEVTGRLIVEKNGGKSRVRSCFSKYPLKFIIPNKVASSEVDAVWVYTITYGGGIVSVCFSILAILLLFSIIDLIMFYRETQFHAISLLEMLALLF